jgi:predicted Ser/Thr protein kinase
MSATDPSTTAPHVPADAEPNHQGADVAAELARVLAGYIADLQAGRAPTPDALLAAHPALAAELRQCLPGIDFIYRAAPAAGDEAARLGDFRIVREAGRGAMGVVYEAEQVSLHRRVALKVLRVGGPADEEARERFQREAETVAGLHHTNIVPVFAVGREQGVHYYAMQFIDGRSLAEVLRQAPGPLDPREVPGWGLQAAEALDHAHQRGVVHRDVKPGNLLLDADGRLWLTDFGLARRADDAMLTLSGVLLGTPRYMSPEQAGGKEPVDHRTDLYSLGATLYELATGRPVCDGDSPGRVLQQILTAEPVPPRRLRRDLPRDLETVLLTCLARDPARRYPTARALAEDLRAVLDDRPIKARRPALVVRAGRWLRSRRLSVPQVMLLGLLGVALVGLIMGGFLTYRSFSRRHQGLVQISASDPAATWDAEVLGPDEDEPLLRFQVPTSEPIEVPAGEYELRLIRPGFLSATYPISVRKEEHQLWSHLLREVCSQDVKTAVVPLPGPRGIVLLKPVKTPIWQPALTPGQLAFRRQHLWSKPAEKVQAAYLLPGSRDLLVTRRVGAAIVLQRLDGETGAPRWLHSSALSRYFSACFGQLLVGEDGTPPALKLNNDGTAALVFLGAGVPTITAVSGKTGNLIWCHGPAEMKQDLTMAQVVVKVVGQPETKVNQVLAQQVVGQPDTKVVEPLVLPDVDGDGVPDLAAVFMDGSRPDGKVRRSLRALSGRTGNELWTVNLPALPPKAKAQPGAMPARKQVDKCFPCMVSIGGRDTILVFDGDRLRAVDARTGQPAVGSRALGLRLIRQPQFADLRGDGSAGVLLLGRDPAGLLRLSARLLPDFTPLWERPWPEMFDLGTPDFPLLMDPGRDGRRGVVVPQALRILEPSGQQARLGVAVLDGATGQPRWERWLGRSNGHHPLDAEQLRLIIGPDLDGDGLPEVFVASVLRELSFQSPKNYLYVDALAGSDGRSLWWWRRLASSGVDRGVAQWLGDVGPLRWWPVRRSGLPLLVVPFKGAREVESCYVLSATTGRLLHLLPRVRHPQVKDLDGDGRAELIAVTGDPSRDAARLNPIRGDAPAELRHAARMWWQPDQPAPDTQAAHPELEEEAVVVTGGPADPRLVVPLPWDQTSWQLINPAYAERGLASLFLFLSAGLIMAISMANAKAARRKAQQRLPPEQLKRAQRLGKLAFLHWVGASVVAVLTVALVGGAMLWQDADRLLPGEQYRWDSWYISAFMFYFIIWPLCIGGTLIFYGTGFLGLWLYKKLFGRPGRVGGA